MPLATRVAAVAVLRSTPVSSGIEKAVRVGLRSGWLKQRRCRLRGAPRADLIDGVHDAAGTRPKFCGSLQLLFTY